MESVLKLFPLLKGLLDRKDGKMSGGEQQLLAIARALIGNPSFLLLDEPCEGLAPVIVEELKETILPLKRTLPILIAEQNARFALVVSDRGYVLSKKASSSLQERRSSWQRIREFSSGIFLFNLTPP